MTDFELEIINALKTQYEKEVIRLCLFHLCQCVYRHIQQEGLQNVDSIREASRSMCALAFVSPEDVFEKVFDKFYNHVTEEFIPVANYFDITYVKVYAIEEEEDQ